MMLGGLLGYDSTVLIAIDLPTFWYFREVISPSLVTTAYVGNSHNKSIQVELIQKWYPDQDYPYAILFNTIT